jgi:hypothetical protein
MGFERRPAAVRFEHPRLCIETPDGGQGFARSEVRPHHGAFQHLDGGVVNLERNRKRMSVLATECERKARRVRKAGGRAVQDFGDRIGIEINASTGIGRVSLEERPRGPGRVGKI